MTATYIELDLLQSNDTVVEHTVTSQGAALNLSAATAIEFYLKPSKTTADTDPAVTKLTLAGGAIALIDAAAGRCNTEIPAAALATAGNRWWRLDLVVSGDRKTAMFGLARIRDT